jgi:transcriptional regulator with XRE-family HTH domain
MIDADIKTIEQLSELTGVNRNTLSDIINGKIFPSSMVMSKLASCLKLTSEDAGRIFFTPKLA